MSREHIVSEGLFVIQKVYVRGLPGCADAFREIGIANLTRKVLCAYHNSALSAVADDPGIRVFRALRFLS